LTSPRMPKEIRARNKDRTPPWQGLIPKQRPSGCGGKGRAAGSINKKTEVKERAKKRRAAQHAKNEEKKRQEEAMEEQRQIEEVRDELRKRFYRQGKELTEEENGKLLAAYYTSKALHYNEKGWTEKQTIEEVQRGWLLADATITKTVEKFEESGEVPKPDSSKRG